MKEVAIGLCGWNGSQRSYFEQFDCIEVQSTFYDPPGVDIARRWKAKAPDNFQFCIKAWQLITHTPASPTYRRLRKPVSESDKPLLGDFQTTEPVMQAWKRTEEIAAAVNACVILFQCPKSFLPTSTNLSNLYRFFRAIKRGPFQLAWEPRGEAWDEDVARELCQELDLIHCVDPFLTRSSHGIPQYWRLHGIGAYSYRYTDEDLLRLKGQLVRTHQPTFLMFNNFSSKVDAIRFREMLGAENERIIRDR